MNPKTPKQNSRKKTPPTSRKSKQTRASNHANKTETKSSIDEELKAANEEVMSMNEERQSTNEELKTSKEELRSLNEELSAVSNRLQDKVIEQEVTNNDLNNLLSSTDIATVFLDKDLCIKRFTPSSSTLLSLIPTDTGRPLSDIVYKVTDEDLIEDANRVLAHFTPLEKEVPDDDGHWYLRRIVPYRTEDNKIEGVVLTFSDISRVKKAEQQVQQLNRLLHTITEIDRVMVQERDENALLERACQILVEHGDFLMAWVGKANFESGEVTPVAYAGMTGDYLQKTEIRCDDTPQGRGPTGMAIRTGKYQINDDINSADFCKPWRQQAHNMGYRSSAAFPLKVNSNVIGAINVYAPIANAFGKENTALLEKLADTIGFALQNYQDAEQLKLAKQALQKSHIVLEQRVAQRTKALQIEVAERKNQQLIIERTAAEEATLATLLRLGLQRLTLPQQLEQTIKELMGHVPWLDLTGEGAIFLQEEKNGIHVLKLVASCNLLPEQKTLCAEVPFGSCLCGSSAEQACVLFATSDDGRHKINFDCVEKHSHYCLPVLIQGSVAGILMLHSTFSHKNEPLIEDFLRRVVDVIGMSISRNKAEEQLILAKQEAEMANNAKTEFLSSMSHELRTPLNAILGFGELLKRSSKNLDADDQESLDYILSSGKHLLGLINEVLDLAKVDAGKADVFIEDVNVSEVLEKCVQLIKPLTLQSNIAILGNWQNIHWVRADTTRLSQVLLNLLMNAVKYNRVAGKIEIDVQSLEGGRIRISVADTGIGIKLEDQSRVYEPFHRLNNIKKFTSGTGIGLNITKKLIELMGGTINFTSEQMKGSVFWIELPKGKPVTVTSLNQATELKQDVMASIPDKGVARKILYVEDDQDNLILMERVINKLSNNELVSATTAEKGLELAVSHQPDLIICDINLPGMDGFEALKELRKNSETKHIPVFALSASAMPEQVTKGYEAGFSAYLTKPIQISALLSAIEGVQQEEIKKHASEQNTGQDKMTDLTTD